MPPDAAAVDAAGPPVICDFASLVESQTLTPERPITERRSASQPFPAPVLLGVHTDIDTASRGRRATPGPGTLVPGSPT